MLTRSITGVSTFVNRRLKWRFDLELDVAVRLRHGGKGLPPTPARTLNMSSTVLAITSETPLSIGDDVELSIHWPVDLGRDCGLNLIVLGKVLGVDGSRTVIGIRKYDFRTRTRLVVVGGTLAS